MFVNGRHGVIEVAVGCAKLAGSRSPQSTTISASAGTPACGRHNIVFPVRESAVAVGCAKLAGSRSPQSTTISASAGTPACGRHNIVFPVRESAVAVGCAKLAGSRSPQSTTISASAGTPACGRHNIVFPVRERTSAINGIGISLTGYDSCQEHHVGWCAGARLLSHHQGNAVSGELGTPYR